MQDEVRSLSSRLDSLDMVSSPVGPVDEFLTTQHDLLHQLSARIDHICAQNNSQQRLKEEAELRKAEHQVLSSLYFPQMYERRQRLDAPYERTFRWVLTEGSPSETRWDNVLAWLRGTDPNDHIYWISGKPGSGKSSLVGFLDETLNPTHHMHPWVEGELCLQASHYFWNSGDSALQKSAAGMMRTILHELLEQAPDLVPRTVTMRRWRSARAASRLSDSWTYGELRNSLMDCITCIGETSKVLLLLDGLDEVKDEDDAHDNLVQLVRTVAALPHVKICVSSRPNPIFMDAFSVHKQLRLQDLTYRDICEYVNGQFERQAQFRNLRQQDATRADFLVEEIIQGADGVFLWVRLVVKQLTRCLRDGSGYISLQRALQEIPRDLDAYFQKMMDSIEPDFRSCFNLHCGTKKNSLPYHFSVCLTYL